MDVVYICRDGDNEELRYSIRSVVKNLKHDNVWVVGGKPSWYTGNHIAVDQSGPKFENARSNMKAIAESEMISDDFILMNDDFFIMQPTNDVEYFHGGLLSNRISYLYSTYGRSAYLTMLNKTHRYLKSIGILAPLDYALHIPFVMNKERLSQILDIPISWRIHYGNLYKVGGTQVSPNGDSILDVKIYLRNGKLSAPIDNSISKKFLSTEDKSFRHLESMLDAEFPDASPFESNIQNRSKIFKAI
jgi:hypothetical protein